MKGLYSKMGCFTLLTISFMYIGCGNMNLGGGDTPAASNSSSSIQTSASMFDDETPLGIKIQSNGYDYNTEYIENAFFETEECLGYSDISLDIYLKLEKPYSAFPCVPLPGGCGGLFDIDNGEPVITVTSDMVRLKHEYIHYMFYMEEGNSDPGHTSEAFDTCS